MKPRKGGEMKEKHIKINTGDKRIEAWGYLTGKKTLRLYVRIVPQMKTIQVIDSIEKPLQINDIKVHL